MTLSAEVAKLNAKLAMRDGVLYALIVTILGHRTADDMKAQLAEFDTAIEAALP